MRWRESSTAVSKSHTSAEDSQVVCCTASAAKIGQMWDCFTSTDGEMILLNNSGNDASFVNGGTVLMQLLFCSVRIYCLVMDTDSFSTQSQF